MWVVYWERGKERMGVLFTEDTGREEYRSETNARVAYREVIRQLEADGFTKDEEVYIDKDEVPGLVEYIGLSRGREAAIVVLLEEEG